MVRRSDGGNRPIVGGHVLKKAYETLDGPLPSIRINRNRHRDFDRAMEILEGLRDSLEVAMVDNEYSQFSKAMRLLRKSQGGS